MNPKVRKSLEVDINSLRVKRQYVSQGSVGFDFPELYCASVKQC